MAPSVLLAVLEYQGRTKRWLTGQTHFSASYLYKVTHGSAQPSQEFVDAAATALGVPPTVLFPGVGVGT